MEGILRTLQTTTALTPAYEIALAKPDVVRDIIEHVHSNWLPLKDGGDPKKYFDILVAAFGLEKRYTKLPGAEEERGQFYLFSKTEKDNLDLRVASEQEIKNSDTVVCFGIDTSGKDYLEKSLKHLNHLLGFRASPVVYHYETSPEDRARDFKRFIERPRTFSDEARKFSRVFDSAGKKRKLYIAHSGGIPFGYMAENAYAEGEKIDRLCFGASIYWDNEEASKSKLIGREISIFAADDILPYTPASNIALLHETAKDSDKAPYKVYYNVHNKDRVMVVLSPAITAYINEQEKTSNFAGHSLGFYLDALGLKGGEIPDALQKLNEAVLAVVKGEDKGQSLGEFLGAVPFIPGLTTTIGGSEYTAGVTARLLLEQYHLSKMKGKEYPEHLFTKGVKGAFTRS